MQQSDLDGFSTDAKAPGGLPQMGLPSELFAELEVGRDDALGAVHAPVV